MMQSSQTPVRRSRRWWLWVGYWLGLFIVMHIPVPAPAPALAGSDKGIHFALYLILTLLGGRYQLAREARASTGALIFWAVIYTAYAAVDEWAQQFAGRTMSSGDWIADVAGVAVGTVVLILLKR